METTRTVQQLIDARTAAQTILGARERIAAAEKVLANMGMRLDGDRVAINVVLGDAAPSEQPAAKVLVGTFCACCPQDVGVTMQRVAVDGKEYSEPRCADHPLTPRVPKKPASGMGL